MRYMFSKHRARTTIAPYVKESDTKQQSQLVVPRRDLVKGGFARKTQDGPEGTSTSPLFSV